jgi:hypothetical protein
MCHVVYAVKAPSACAVPPTWERLEAVWSNIAHTGGKRPMYRGRRRSPKPQESRAESERQPHDTPWVEIYAALHTLHAQGLPVATVARQLGISRPMVYACLRREAPLGPKRPQFQWSTQVLTPYIPYLIRHWRESGGHSAQLWQEIQALGYTYSARTVCRFIAQLRRASEAWLAPETQGSPYTRPQGPSARGEEGFTRPWHRGWRGHDRRVRATLVSPDGFVSILRKVQVHDPLRFQRPGL